MFKPYNNLFKFGIKAYNRKTLENKHFKMS